MRLWAWILMAALAACGGAGGGSGNQSNGDLVVSFSYPGTSVTTFKSTSVTPSLSDLNGNTPHFAVVSGSLPEGLALDPSSGVISGVPVQPGSFFAAIALTVKGFSGSVSANYTATVNGVSLIYTGSSRAPVPTAATTFDVGAPLSVPFDLYLLDPAVVTNGSLGLGPLVPATGVSVTYRIRAGGALPSGLALDSMTGAITGTPMVVGDLNSAVEGVVSYMGQSFVFTDTIPFRIKEPSATLVYSPTVDGHNICISTPTEPFASAPPGGTAVLVTPSLAGGQPGDLLSGFSASTDLWGLSLDPDTGVISGTSFAPNNYCATVLRQFSLTFTLTRGGYSTTLTQFFQLVE